MQLMMVYGSLLRILQLPNPGLVLHLLTLPGVPLLKQEVDSIELPQLASLTLIFMVR